MEEILRDLASAHTVIAVGLTGVIMLQAVQAWVDKAPPEREPVVSSGALPPTSAPAAAASAIQQTIEDDGEADTETEPTPSSASTPVSPTADKRGSTRRRKKAAK